MKKIKYVKNHMYELRHQNSDKNMIILVLRINSKSIAGSTYHKGAWSHNWHLMLESHHKTTLDYFKVDLGHRRLHPDLLI